jgi:hypothetical protein
MAEFERLRDELAEGRRKLEYRRQKAHLAREAVRQHERALETFERTETERGGRERERLEGLLKGARTRARMLDEGLGRRSARVAGQFKAFEVFTDPRESLGRWPDSHPILLFPLRLETRFKLGDAGQPQLWVRVYPDDCLIDTFEESLTEQEVATAQAFWAAVWSAGGDEALERAAWRELVASHGSGRAGWIVRQYLPLNPADKPPRNSPTDVLLIVTAPGPLPAEASDYWEAAWKAEGDAQAAQAAFDTLEQKLGEPRAREIVEKFRPANFDDAPAPPRTRADVRATVTVLQLTPAADLQTRRTSWSSAPRVELLPERFVLVATSRDGKTRAEIGNPILAPLVVGPDPNAPPAEQLKPVGDTLQIPDELAWMFDFEKALAVGMAFRFDLTEQQAAEGFERVVVVGLRLGDSAEQGALRLGTLLERHLHSRAGLEIVPQGTPTNNTEKGGSGYSFRDDSEATFDAFFRQTPQYDAEPNPLLRRDGQWLADLLGLSPALARRIPNAGGLDQSDARAMQIALWPGTLGYMMKTQLAPVFDDETVAATRAFFTRHVSGRGPLPALRIGAQPYGILPTTAFDRINWFRVDDQQPASPHKSTYMARLYAILRRVDDDWKPLVGRLSFVGKRGANLDPHQLLLDVLGLHPNSVEYYPLQAESVEHKFYELSFWNFSFALNFFNLFPAIIPLTLLRSLGYAGQEVPELLNKVFKARQTPLDGPLIDDRPLSESEGIRAYAAGKNYIQWLTDAARTGFEALQQESGFDAGKKPAALLYLLLRHALQLSFHETAVRLGVTAGVIQDATLLMRDAPFVHVSAQPPAGGTTAAAAAASESRYDLLFRADERVTRDATLLIGDYVARNVMVADPDLREQIEALERLSLASTARLERAFAEHIDCCSYRLDAWKTGLLSRQLELMRQAGQRQEQSAGTFLGAFGWLEQLRPEGKVLMPAELPDDLAVEINRHDTTPLTRDATNGGLVHAPSLNHATTAAVLRNGYLANDGRLAVNLSSRRVQLALGVLEGMRNGQSLGALLGYQFERHVHDNGPLLVRELIYPLRRQFPLAVNQITATRSQAGGAGETDEERMAREAIAAMNVVDGRKMLEHAEREQNFAYPFGVTTLPRRAADREAAITNALAHVRDVNDAVADLVLAEGVHQAVLGNYDRSAGMLDAFAKGNYPPEPEVIQTPRSGIALTLRAAIHLPPQPPANPLPAELPTLTPLAAAEPALNSWLAGRLPAVAGDIVGCRVKFTDRATNTEQTPFISQRQLGLHPVDLVYRVEASPDQALGDLDDLILRHLHAHHTPRHDREILIQYTERVNGHVTWFELQALLRSLRALATASRPLQPADLMRANDATLAEQSSAALDAARVEAARDDLNGPLLTRLDALAAALGDATRTIDEVLTQYADTVAAFAAYRLPQTGTGFVFEWRANTYTALAGKLSERATTWEDRLDKYDALIAAYDALPPAATPPEELIPRLQEAESLVSVQLTEPVPAATAADAAAYRGSLDAKRAAFSGKRDDLLQLVDAPRATLAQLLADAKAQEAPVRTFDLEALEFSGEEKEVARFRAQLADAVARLKEDVTKLIARVDALLAQHGDAAGAADKVTLLQNAAKRIFGEDFQFVPRVTLPAAAADELANAWQHSLSGDLTRHLMRHPANNPAGRDFPVDDWLHGVARVRDKVRHWENAVLLGDAFAAAKSGDLTPLQLPHKPGEPWLALELPPDHQIAGDRLLYTAHFAEDFDKTQPVCGLLIDEWTEVIPGTEETTGIAFHYDRPNCEPPQSWLLALPAVRDGSWSWEELLAAVNDALDSAKRRAIEPAHLDDTPYSWFLPATMSSYTFPEISISNNLLRNALIYSRLKEE